MSTLRAIMLGPVPFTEEMSSETLFGHVSQAFRQRAEDYLGTEPSTLVPFISGADFEVIIHEEPGPPLSMLMNVPANEELPKLFAPFTEQVGVRFGLDYDYPPNDPRYNRLPVLRHFVEISFGVPVALDMVRGEDRAKAIGTLIVEYPGELTRILGEKGIETEEQDVYEIANTYPEKSEEACFELMRTIDEPVYLHEIRTLRYELSEREQTIRRSMTRVFESGTTVTMLSSITEINGAICDDESAIPDEFSDNPRITDHDAELGDLFAQILAGCMGEEAPKIDHTYQYAREIWAMLTTSYSPYTTLVAADA